MINETIQSLANLATALTFGAAAWQLWETNKQNKKSILQKRSEYLISLYNSFINDRDMFNVFYQLEYNDFVYNELFHHSEIEKHLDKLLGHFSNIGRIYNLGIINREDLKFFDYEFLVIYRNNQVQEYLTFLDNWCLINNIKDRKYNDFRLVGDFLDNE